MPRAYTVGTVALTLGMPIKWVDNVLSHHRVSGVLQERQGVSRKVAFEGLLQLALAVRLIQELEIPVGSALHVANDIAKTRGRYDTPTGVTISMDLDRLQSDLERSVAQAVEITPVPKRGRPPRSTPLHPSRTGRLD